MGLLARLRPGRRHARRGRAQGHQAGGVGAGGPGLPAAALRRRRATSATACPSSRSWSGCCWSSACSRARRPSCAGVMLVAFVIGIASAWARGLTIDCGCFGQGGTIAASRRITSRRYCGTWGSCCVRPGSRPAAHGIQPRTTPVRRGKVRAMSTKATRPSGQDRGGRAPRRRGGANRIVVATVVAVLAIAAIVIGVIVADQGKKADPRRGAARCRRTPPPWGPGSWSTRPPRPARRRWTSTATSSARPVPPSRRSSATSWWA